MILLKQNIKIRHFLQKKGNVMSVLGKIFGLFSRIVTSQETKAPILISFNSALQVVMTKNISERTQKTDF
jgi:hypothetical protein